MIRPASAFCCDECGHIHLSQHTTLDTFCPACQAARELQTLVQCTGCGMPCYPIVRDIGTTWLHCDEELDEDCGHYPRVIYLRGLRRKNEQRGT